MALSRRNYRYAYCGDAYQALSEDTQRFERKPRMSTPAWFNTLKAVYAENNTLSYYLHSSNKATVPKEA